MSLLSKDSCFGKTRNVFNKVLVLLIYWVRQLVPNQLLEKIARFLLFSNKLFWGQIPKRLNKSTVVSILSKVEEIEDTEELLNEINKTLPPAIPDFPEVSIIIPAYNHAKVTLKCLLSIGLSKPQISYEIIVIDDNSTDETFSLLSKLTGIRLIRNLQNMGFLESCNSAAKHARGNYLVLLNNDTIALPGWLEAMRETFKLFPNVGFVGAKLLNRDRTLQEAGGIIWKDGTGWNYGRGDNALNPKYNYVREVDYCSGACIMVPKCLWEALGGFDRRFSPAYYEDTDLAFRIRNAGYKVIYQPNAQIIHLEGVTSGTDISSGIKRYQEINRRKFVEKWGYILINHGSSELEPRFYVNRYTKRNVLYIDSTTPTPDRDSGSIDAFEYLKIIRQDLNCALTFIPDDLNYVGDYTTSLQKVGVECLYFPFIVSAKGFLKKNARHFDVIILSRYPIAKKYIDIVRKYAPASKIIFNTVDLHFLREERKAKVEGNIRRLMAAQKMKKEELEIIQKSDLTLVVSKEEKEIIETILPNVRTTVIPIPRYIPGRKREFDPRKDIVFIGGYQHPPNVDAVIYFVQNIWPLVHQVLPEVRFIIAGSNMPPLFSNFRANNVLPIGYVKDLSSIFDNIRLSIAPLRYGAGVKGKIVTSLSFGVPCVATPIAAEGMGLEHGKEILIADTESKFAEYIIRAYQDRALWYQLSDNGTKAVREKFSIESAQKKWQEIFEELLSDEHQRSKQA